MAQIRQVVSESLQATVRRLLPSQQGFTEDLQASNVITPIIDLTPTAEGSLLDTDLARAIAFDSQTAFTATDGTVALANSPGFWRIFGVSLLLQTAGGDRANNFQMSDGLSTKVVWSHRSPSSTGTYNSAVEFDFVVFLASGESISAISNSVSYLAGSYRQVADVNGNIVNPAGFEAS